MGEFELVDIQSVSKEVREEAVERLYSVYHRSPKTSGYYKEFREKTLEERAICVVKDKKLYGVASYMQHSGRLVLSEFWATPSKEFVKRHKLTIGRSMFMFLHMRANEQGLRFATSEYIGAGRRFNRRSKGELPIKPKPPLKRKR